MIKTAITEMFGIKYPIVCGAMMWLAGPKLCAAISQAGGMGNLTSGSYETEESFREAIHEIRRRTDKPFIVGLTLMPSVRITPEMNRMYVRVAAEERVAAMEISGTPIDKGLGMEYLDQLKQAGVRVFHKVGALKHALHAQKVGYDGVYCTGYEAGGHPHSDNVTSLVLTPTMVEALDIPVISAGGMADGRSLAAALALGAQGVMMASRFIVTTECEVHDRFRQELVSRRENETTIFGRHALGIQGRALKNHLIEQVLAIEESGGGLNELLPLISGERIRKAWDSGDVDEAPLMVGQSIGRIREITSCAEVLEKMCIEARGYLQQARDMLN